MKLIIVDLDGTLFDTKDVNYHAYREAAALFGYNMEYSYYCNFCNGRHYLDFLPQITTADLDILSQIHRRKKEVYKKYLDKAVINRGLLDILKIVQGSVKIAVVTTASRQNSEDILNKFGIYDLFDLVLTHEDIIHAKPDPEGFLKAMDFFGVRPEDTVIFEDSEVGIKAAEKTGACLFVAKGYN